MNWSNKGWLIKISSGIDARELSNEWQMNHSLGCGNRISVKEKFIYIYIRQGGIYCYSARLGFWGWLSKVWSLWLLIQELQGKDWPSDLEVSIESLDSSKVNE